MDKATHDKLLKEIQTSRVITVATLVDRLKINGSLARKALVDLKVAGQITEVLHHHAFLLYSTPSAFLHYLRAVLFLVRYSSPKNRG